MFGSFQRKMTEVGNRKSFLFPSSVETRKEKRQEGKGKI